nr:UvrD-helicase domain-containing protein [Calditrichia bacterium]
MTSFQSRLEGLNPQQKEAVTVVDKPVLVLAGAGSGKTRVLTHKIAYLLETTDLKPWELLAVTFTNKAAAEMRKRVQDSLRRSVDGLWIGTFHSICARILRVEASHLGYDSNYTIYDVDDQVRLLQQIMNEFNIRGKALTPRGVQYVISDAKNRMVDPHRFEQLAHTPQSRQIAPIYKAYQQQLRRNNAMDFDDLMIHPLDIFTRVPEVLEKYQKRFRYVLVDEYQDTNKAQYHLIRKLSEKHQKITVVGDEDQSIYRWRGADIENILNFEKDYPECLVVRLEQNYRSTQNILDAANIVVAHNQKRLGKNLWS